MALLEKETLDEVEGETPRDSEAVGDMVTVDEELTVEEGVGGGVPVGDMVGEPVGVEEGVAALEVLLDRDLLPVFEGVAPLDSDPVGVADTLALALRVGEVVKDAVPVAVPVEVGERVELGVGVADKLLEKDPEGVRDWDAPLLRDAVGEEVRVEDALTVEVGVAAAVPVDVGVGGGVLEGEGVTELVALPDRDAVLVFEGEAPGEMGAVGEADTVELPVRVEEGV